MGGPLTTLRGWCMAVAPYGPECSQATSKHLVVGSDLRGVSG